MTFTRAELERRRLQAAADLLRGMRHVEVARQYDVSRTTASRWSQALRRGDSLASRSAPGRKRRLDRDVLLPLLRDRRKSYAMIAREIERRFGVAYTPDSLSHIALENGILRQVQTRRAQA